MKRKPEEKESSRKLCKTDNAGSNCSLSDSGVKLILIDFHHPSQVEAVENYTRLTLHLDGLRRWTIRREEALKNIQQFNIPGIPLEFARDAKTITTAWLSNQYMLKAIENFNADKETILKIIRENPITYQHVYRHWKSDPEVVIEAIKLKENERYIIPRYL